MLSDLILVDYNMLRVPVNASARQVLRAFGSELGLYRDGAWVSFDCVLSGLPLDTRLLLSLKTLMIGDSLCADSRKKIE